MRGTHRESPSAARTARSASSSCACGTPNTARIASPMNFSRDAAVALDLGVHELEELALERTNVLGLEPLAERRRAGEIGEEDRDDAPLLVLREIACASRTGRRRRAARGAEGDRRRCSDAACGARLSRGTRRTRGRSVRRLRPPRRTRRRREPRIESRHASFDARVPSGQDIDSVLAQPLAHEVLERGPRSAGHVEQPIDLPLREQAGIRTPRFGPVGHLGEAPEGSRELGALHDGALEPLLALRAGRIPPLAARSPESRRCVCTCETDGSERRRSLRSRGRRRASELLARVSAAARAGRRA